jgi:hypothetical protein
MAWGGRLPTEAELQAIIGPVLMCIASGMLTWQAPPSGESMWTSTGDPASPSFHYAVFLSAEPPVTAPNGDAHWVLCVK